MQLPNICTRSLLFSLFPNKLIVIKQHVLLQWCGGDRRSFTIPLVLTCFLHQGKTVGFLPDHKQENETAQKIKLQSLEYSAKHVYYIYSFVQVKDFRRVVPCKRLQHISIMFSPAKYAILFLQKTTINLSFNFSFIFLLCHFHQCWGSD